MKEFISRICRYIYYCLKAKDEFSIHSPFLFAFHSNIIKRKKSKKSLKKDKLISKIINYYPDFNVFTFEFPNTITLTNRSNILNISVIDTTNFAITPAPYNDIRFLIENPFTIIILFDIHKTMSKHIFWKDLCSEKLNCVKLDFFHYGILINNPNVFSRQVLILKK